MKRLREYADKHGVSRPVFDIVPVVRRDHEGASSSIEEINLELKQEYKYVPEINEADPLTVLIAKSRNEAFSIGIKKFTVSNESTVSNALRNVNEIFLNFLRRNLPNKQPTHTIIYKWYRRDFLNRLTYPDALSENLDNAVLALYSYVYRNVDDSGKILDSKKEHSKNIIALLEALMEKIKNESKKR